MDRQYPVYFSQSPSSYAEVKGPYVLISPDNWDDYGNKSYGKLQIFDVRGELKFVAQVILFALHKYPWKEGSREDSIWDYILNTSSPSEVYTVFTELDHYRKIRQIFGNTSLELLESIQDIPFLREYAKLSEQKYVNLKRTGSYVYSLQRNSEAYYAFHNAFMILRGVEQQRLDIFKTEIALSYRLRGFQNSHKFVFRFENWQDVILKRTAVVIGENGVGKSTALSKLIEAAVSLDDELTDTEGNQVLVSRILAFSPNLTGAGSLPRPPKESAAWYESYTLNPSRISKYNRPITEIISRLFINNDFIAEQARWEIFLSALEKINNYEEICLSIEYSDPYEPYEPFLPLIEIARGSERSKLQNLGALAPHKGLVRRIGTQIYPLSSGEVTFIRFAATVCLNIENGSLLLLDEPETHLHPQLINSFMAILNDLLNKTNSIAIIATHSAYFVREIFEDQVFVINRDSPTQVSIRQPGLKTYGADVGRISRYVFGEDRPSLGAEELLDEFLENGVPWKTLVEEYGMHLSDEFIMEYRRKLRKEDEKNPATSD